jgi:hypothetical protein
MEHFPKGITTLTFSRAILESSWHGSEKHRHHNGGFREETEV